MFSNLPKARELNWGIIFAVLFSLLIWSLIVFPPKATAQTSTHAASRPDTLYILEPRDNVRELWNAVVECAGEYRDTTQTFEEIVWIRRGVKLDEAGDTLLGEWVPGDTIFVTRGYENNDWVLAHEMLHHALNGPPTGPAHPFNPFAYPCGLLEYPKEEREPEPEPEAPLTSSTFAYPVLGYAVYSQGTILAGHGWHR